MLADTLTDTRTLALTIFYRFSHPDRRTVRQAVYHKGDQPLKPGTDKAIEEHLKSCADCAYETLPWEPQAA
jgi:hypothetical protein